MQTKLFEIRDEGTFIPVVATLMRDTDSNILQNYLLRRCGYGADSRSVLLTALDGDGSPAWSDYFGWGLVRTRFVAHRYIQDNWDDLIIGQVIDVEYILGEKTEPKKSEFFIKV